MSSMFLAYDYAINVTKQQGITPVSLDYIRDCYVVVKGKATSGDPEVVKVTTPDQVKAKTDDLTCLSLFDGGMTSFHLIVLLSTGSIADAKPIVATLENKTMTVLAGADLVTKAADATTNLKVGDAVVGACFKIAGAAEAKTLAATECAFIDEQDESSMFYAFGQLLSQSSWTNLQYVKMPTPATTPTVSDVGTAEGYFNDRVSFFLNDDAMGRLLGFFGCGGASIVDRYVRAQVSRDIQAKGLGYISLNRPNNTPVSRDFMTIELRNVFVNYETQGLLLEGSQLSITESNENFVVSGTFKMALPEALWRAKFVLIG